MEGYAFDTGILMIIQFWHIFFLISMGLGSTLMMLIEAGNMSNTSYVPISDGFKLLVIGMLVASTNYLAAQGMSVNNQTIL
jgi:hypothetical protein